MVSTVRSNPVTLFPRAEMIQNRLAQVRVAAGAAAEAAGMPRYAPPQSFRRHHSDWSGGPNYSAKAAP